MKKIPKIKLQLTNEDQFNSSKIINKTVLFFYPKALTGGCSIEVADFQKYLINSYCFFVFISNKLYRLFD